MVSDQCIGGRRARSSRARVVSLVLRKPFRVNPLYTRCCASSLSRTLRDGARKPFTVHGLPSEFALGSAKFVAECARIVQAGNLQLPPKPGTLDMLRCATGGADQGQAAEGDKRRLGNCVKAVLIVLFAWGRGARAPELEPRHGIKNIRKCKGTADANRPWMDSKQPRVAR